jgi:hypothetical protein
MITFVALRHKEKTNESDINDYITKCLDSCDEECYPFFLHSLIVLEHTKKVFSGSSDQSDASESSSGSSNATISKYFENNSITRMIVIERPRTSVQLYVAQGMGNKYHFASPTVEVPSLYNLIKTLVNKDLKILFIPRTCKKYESESLQVNNDLLHRKIVQLSNANGMEGLIHTPKSNSDDRNSPSNNKRTNGTYISIGLQTMYSHQQHTSRYSMLAHSRPHMTTVKDHPLCLRSNILNAYEIISDVLESTNVWKDQHPFSSKESTVMMDEAWFQRLDLRQELKDRVLLDDINVESYDLPLNNLFESCTIQQTGRLNFHRDPMNCPTMDWTLALHVPHSNKDDVCMSYLYYSRKCVGDYTARMGSLNSFMKKESSCKLAKLCLKSITETQGIFNYQATLFENDMSLDKLAETFEKSATHSCPDVATFTGIPCFKNGAAFDKMGYYSIFVNVFLSLHYLGIATDIDDSISLCIYFGLLCNGTSNLAATWNAISENVEFAVQWCEENNDSTRLFRLLIHLETYRRKKDGNKKTDIYGSCKLHRFQYANYGADIVNEADMVHCYVKDFLCQYGENGNLRQKDVYIQHSELYKSMSHVKGIGPLSFNQFWHSLCLCGVLPIKYISFSAIAPNSGPAKLIQTFYPNCRAPDECLKKMHEVKARISSFGMNKVTDFFLENMFCELYRMGNKSDIATKAMATDVRRDAFLSNDFHAALVNSSPTKNPDIYFKNPFNASYQHLFRVEKEDLIMRPSFLDNSITSSSTLRCKISYSSGDNESINVIWSGDYVRKSKVPASAWFISG